MDRLACAARRCRAARSATALSGAEPVPRERIVLYALLTSLTAISIDALLPGLRSIAHDLGSKPPWTTQHVVTLFVFGMVFGELVFGPLSDAIGRRKTLVLGLGIYCAGTLVALLAGSMEWMIIGRFVQGVGVAGPKIATRAMIRDRFEGDAMARVMSLLFTLYILVPMLAPALGQGIVTVAGWRGVFVLYLGVACLLGLWMWLRHPETLAAQRRVPFRPRILLQNTVRALASRYVCMLILATGLVYGAQLLYLGIAADLFFKAYGVTDRFPLYFALLASGIGFAAYLNGRLVVRIGMETMARYGFVGLALAGLLLVVASSMYAGRPPFSVFMATGFAAFFAIGILFGNLNAMAMRSLGQIAGLGASLVASGSSLVATLFSLGLGAFYDGTVSVVALGFLCAGVSALILSEIAIRSDRAPVRPVR